MKKMKKWAALLLTVIMTMVLATTALAEGTAKITINGAANGATYTLYKIFDLATDGTHYSYKVTSEWKEFCTTGAGKDYVTVDSNGYVTWKSGETAAFAAAAGKVITGKSYNTYVNESGNSTFVIDTLDTGYYLIQSSMGTVFGVATAEDGNAREITEKTQLPNISKTADKVTAAIGDTITYTATLNVETGGTGYVMYDKMSDGFKDVKVTSVSYDNEALAAGKYIVDTTATDAYTFKITFDDSIGYTTGKSIVVTYTAELDADADIGLPGNSNKIWMSHGTPAVTVEGNTTSTYTYEVIVNKTDGTNALTGAGFKLQKKGDDDWTDVKTIGAEPAVSTFTFSGLDVGEYKLIESTVPTGYNKAPDVEFTVSVTNVSASGYTLTSTVGTVDNNNGTVTHTVINKTGTVLPDTGGIGTPLFYIVGSAMMLGAAVLLLNKKRDARG